MRRLWHHSPHIVGRRWFLATFALIYLFLVLHVSYLSGEQREILSSGVELKGTLQELSNAQALVKSLSAQVEFLSSQVERRNGQDQSSSPEIDCGNEFRNLNLQFQETQHSLAVANLKLNQAHRGTWDYRDLDDSNEPFPQSFDASAYFCFYPEFLAPLVDCSQAGLASDHCCLIQKPSQCSLSPSEARALRTHYEAEGQGLGLRASMAQNFRLNGDPMKSDLFRNFKGTALEIGPYIRPILRGPNVKYFDILSTEEMRARLPGDHWQLLSGKKTLKEALDLVPEIDYHDITGDLSHIPRNQFELVMSSHALEHQLNFVHHLEMVSDLLKPGGYFMAIVPNKLFCFDHTISQTTIADVLDDYFNPRSRHKLRSVIEHRALTTHSNPTKHWEQHNATIWDIGKVPPIRDLDSLQRSINEWIDAKNSGAYVDVHNYQFLPQSLLEIMKWLWEMKLTDFEVHRMYPSTKNTNEFVIVLKKSVEDVKPPSWIHGYNKNRLRPGKSGD